MPGAMPAISSRSSGVLIALFLQQCILRLAMREVTKVGDHWAFVVPAYLLVLSIWSGASAYDFISSK